jgi:hypothetical protein
MLVSLGGLIVTHLSSCLLKDLEKAVARLVILSQNSLVYSVTVSANASPTCFSTPLLKISWTCIWLTFSMDLFFHVW